MASDSNAITVADILAKDGCKIQSLTVSEQHATLLVSHSNVIDNNEHMNIKENVESKTTCSLLKLTVVPFHKALLGGNPVMSPEDIEKGHLPERNMLQHNPQSSDEIISFLRKYEFVLKSESGAEYSYYCANPNADLIKSAGRFGAALEGKRDIDNEVTSASTEKESNLIADTASKFGSFDVELISPASAYQISRAMPGLGHVLIHETPELYNNVVEPYIRSVVDNGSLSWIANVVEVKKEKERLLVNNDNFVVNIDTKWRSHPPPLTTPREQWFNHPSTADLYCLAIVKRYDIACIRDLRGGHIPLLKQIQEEGLKAIEKVYGVGEDQIRAFVHYQPQFYHLHVHFTRLENEVGCAVERGHLISDVIQNLELDAEYYCKRTITYKLKKGTPLQSLIDQHQTEEGNSCAE
ncbi:hypothetical protein ACHAWF_004294 [Thalassiosira exigua]